MDGVSSAIAFFEVAETCVKVGKTVIGKIRAYRYANERVTELILRLEGIWVKTETQVQALAKVAKASTYHVQLQDFHHECLRRLLAKLYAADTEIQTFISEPSQASQLTNLRPKPGAVKKLRYSMLESRLKSTIADLDQWSAIFDPSWFLITLQNDVDLNSHLDTSTSGEVAQDDIRTVKAIRSAIRTSTGRAGSIFLSADYLSTKSETLQNSTSAICTISGTQTTVIIDTTAYPSDIDVGRASTHVRDLARILSCSQPNTLGLLNCLGVTKMLDPTGAILQYQYVFAIPTAVQSKPTSLRTLLQSKSPSLDDKLRIARSMTRAVAAVHCSDFVHKSIRPDNVLVFEDEQGRKAEAYLVGFERSRPASATTSLTGDMTWERDLYRHPTRQGIRPEEVYVMQHDIYSLGVCLLEIGLWDSLVIPSEIPRPSSSLDIAELISQKNSSKAAWDVKKILGDLASSSLPSAMGSTYTNVVLLCLSCLDTDEDTNLFSGADDLYDQDGILVGVAFIEKVLSSLHSISL